MESATPPPTPIGLQRLLDPRFLLALAALILNDRWAKATFGNAITGKVSDIAGMVVLPLLLIAVAEVVAPRRTVSTVAARRITRRAALATSGSLLAAIKLSEGAAHFVVIALETATGTSHAIVADPTDLIGLAALFVADRVARRSRPIDAGRIARVLRSAVFGLGLFACLATSWEYDDGWVDLSADDDGNVVASAWRDEAQRDPITSTDRGRTWRPTDTARPTDDQPETTVEPVFDRGPICLRGEPNLCIRITSEEVGGRTTSRIEESNDAGVSWSAVWTVDDTKARWITEQYGISGTIDFADIVRLDDDTVLVSGAHLEPLRRDPTTGSWTPTQAEVQELPGQWLLVFWMVAAALIGAVRRARARSLEALVWASAAAGVFIAGGIAAGDSVGPGVVVGSTVAVGLLVVLALLAGFSAKRQRLIDYVVRWGSAGAAMTAIAAPLVLFDMARLSWQATTRASEIALLLAPITAGLFGTPPAGVAGGRRPSPPSGSDQPPPPRAADVAPPRSGLAADATTGELPIGLLLLAPMVAVPGAIVVAMIGPIRGGVALATGGGGHDLLFIGDVGLALGAYAVTTAWWCKRVVLNSSAPVTRMGTRLAVIGSVSLAGPILLGVLGHYWLAAAVAFLTPVAVMRVGFVPPSSSANVPPPPESPVPPAPQPPDGGARPLAAPPAPRRRP